jgi:hypothetical protein
MAAPVATADDLESSFQALKEAEASKDAAKVLKLASETSALARKAISEPAPETDKEAWTARVAHAKEVDVYTEYALYATAVQSQPATMVELLTALEAQNPTSKYLDQGYSAWFSALHSLKKDAEIVPTAQRALKSFPNQEDALAVLMESALGSKQMGRAATYAERIITHMNAHQKPAGMAAADWERKRNTLLGRSRWVAGVAHAEQNNHYEADRDLRAALPLVTGTPMHASCLFYLGLSNYQLAGMLRDKGKMLEAAKFSEQAAALGGPLQQQAWRNATAMKAEAAKLR